MWCNKSTAHTPILLFSPGHQTMRQLIRDSHSLGLKPSVSPYQTKFRGTVSHYDIMSEDACFQLFLASSWTVIHTRMIGSSWASCVAVKSLLSCVMFDIPEDWKSSVVLPVYKGKGDPMECGS